MATNIDINKVADLLILLCNENGIAISPLKLQKLLYYTQAWHWVYFNGADIFTQQPEAWVNGPVYPCIYNRFKTIGKYDSITTEAANIQYSLSDCINIIGLDQDQQNFIDAIFKHYGLMSHDRLVFLTHSEKPWSESREGLSPFEPSNNTISKDTTISYYTERLNRNRANVL
ncbi:MAG: DUF4065 domain-containing protein [Muribaculaceae bacterium]|nr:DUF4065 domain-containing protein [Muribaculaceae bacterium]